ncbi:hypothetical protein OT109_18740 [Phycisphaeraceae bacterium D3-23]
MGLHLLTQWQMDRSAVEDVVRFDQPTYRLRYRLLNLDREMSLPMWFSAALMAGNGGLMLLAGWAQHRRGGGGVLGWLFLGLFFLALSVDEASAIHEVLVDRVQGFLGEYATGLLFYAWYVPVLALGAVILIGLVPFLRGLPRRTFWLLALSVGVFLLGAVGFESLMGMAVEPTGSDEPPLQSPGWRFVALVVMEEGLELLGMALLCYAMLSYLSLRVRLTLVDADDAAPRV